MDQSSAPPPPPPRLVVDGVSGEVDPETSLNSPESRHKRRLSKIRHSLTPSSQPSSPTSPSSALPIPLVDNSGAFVGDDKLSVHSSLQGEGGPSRIDRIAARLHLPRSETLDSVNSDYDEDGLLRPGHGIVVSDSRSTGSFDARERTASATDTELEGKDLYRWAVMIENQRGLTLFGSSKYSSSSLFPNDPPPYSIPSPSASAQKKRSSSSAQKSTDHPQLNVTPHNLEDYQLPDASWVWLSKSWLVQMDGNGGSVDGFEYNWCFRDRGWRSVPGTLSTGAWVRRRRWVRLMMRPAQRTSNINGEESSDNSSQPISIPPSASGSPDSMSWTGDVDRDWLCARRILRGLGTDGRRIAMWQQWLVPPTGARPRAASEEQNEISKLSTSEKPAPRLSLATNRNSDHAEAMLNAYISDILQSFVFPESRRSFLDMLAAENVSLQPSSAPPPPEFFSTPITPH